MAQCEYYDFSCVACKSSLYDGGNKVPSKRHKHLRTVTSTQTRQFCKGEPHNCVFHPRGLAYAPRVKQQASVRRAIEKDNLEMGGSREGSSGSSKMILTYIILAAIAFLMFKAWQDGF
ncbi:hypothetical protein [Paenibacillus polymyxa]|uniref:hypothetical protein n=1 Tax=Paenibacillus polymyxa TaxID=1406 RepID=UPI0020254931|nr:hypothetical protein [Paenibacillus polymyxa]WDZ55423.1 hypothetical protein MF622_09180 [Paenibacillus polymyxa]